MHLFTGVTTRTGNRDPVLRPGGGPGRPAPREALLVWPRPGGGPLGRGDGRLWGGETRHGAGGDRPGEGQQHQEEHAGPTAPQRHWFLSQSGEDLTTKQNVVVFLLFRFPACLMRNCRMGLWKQVYRVRKEEYTLVK